MCPETLQRRILTCLDPFDEPGMVNRMAGHYRTLHLLEAGGKWVSPLLGSRSEELLPGAVTIDECNRFVQQMMDFSLRNPYFASFLERAINMRFPKLESGFRAEGAIVIPDALAFAMTLDRITRVCCDDYRILEVCYHITKRTLRQTSAFRRVPFFYRIKMNSIDPVIYFTIQAHKRPPEKLNKGSASLVLQINILEAVFSDILMGLSDNARAGWVLTLHKSGHRVTDPFTGAGPNHWSPDGKAICLRHPFQTSWNDLYQIWNMAFVSKLYDLPFVISKLLIPEVSDYAAEPGRYMYKRIIALYLYMAWCFFDRSHRSTLHLPLMDWSDPDLTRFWGACAREAAREYSYMFKSISDGPDSTG